MQARRASRQTSVHTYTRILFPFKEQLHLRKLFGNQSGKFLLIQRRHEEPLGLPFEFLLQLLQLLARGFQGGVDKFANCGKSMG